jgi:hypothetical protein
MTSGFSFPSNTTGRRALSTDAERTRQDAAPAKAQAFREV